MERLSGLSVHLGFSGAEAEHREGVAGAGNVHLNVKAGHSPGTHPDSGETHPDLESAPGSPGQPMALGFKRVS